MCNFNFILIKLSIYIIIMNKKIVIFLILCLILVIFIIYKKNIKEKFQVSSASAAPYKAIFETNEIGNHRTAKSIYSDSSNSEVIFYIYDHTDPGLIKMIGGNIMDLRLNQNITAKYALNTDPQITTTGDLTPTNVLQAWNAETDAPNSGNGNYTITDGTIEVSSFPYTITGTFHQRVNDNDNKIILKFSNTLTFDNNAVISYPDYESIISRNVYINIIDASGNEQQLPGPVNISSKSIPSASFTFYGIVIESLSSNATPNTVATSQTSNATLSNFMNSIILPSTGNNIYIAVSNSDPASPSQTSASVATSQTSASTLSDICINEIQGYSQSNRQFPIHDYIELYNRGNTTVDISRYSLTVSDDQDTQPPYVIPPETRILPGGYITFYKYTGNTQNFSISRDGGNTITLKNNLNRDIDIFVGPTEPADNNIERPFTEDRSYGRYPDGSSNIIAMFPTPNSSNSLSPITYPTTTTQTTATLISDLGNMTTPSVAEITDSNITQSTGQTSQTSVSTTTIPTTSATGQTSQTSTEVNYVTGLTVTLTFDENIEDSDMNNLTEQIRPYIINISNGDVNSSDIMSVMFQENVSEIDIIFTNTALVSINPQRSLELVNLIRAEPQVALSSRTYTISNVYYIPMESPCLDITNQTECDEQVDNYSCYWQDNRCHVDYSDDTTNCYHFTPKGEFYCPPNNCIWLNDACQPKTGRSQTQTQTQTQGTSQIPIQANNIKCEAINTSNDANVRRNECDFFNCRWDEILQLCTDNINHGCELKNSKEQCLTNNIDQLSSQNRCKWIPNINDIGGHCMDNNTVVPCQLYKTEACPIENKLDIYGNIIQPNQCILDNNNNCMASTNNTSSLTCETNNYLGSCPQNNCKSVQIKSQDEQTLLPTHTKNICVDRFRLPCSALETNNCLGVNASLCELENGVCNVKNINILDEIDTNLRNPNLINTLSDLQNMSGSTANLMKVNNPLIGQVLTNTNRTYQINNDIQNEAYTFNTSSRDSNKLRQGDNIILKMENSSFKDTFKILNITNNQNVYTVYLDKFITILPNNDTTNLNKLNWIVSKPVNNLYNSYSDLTSIKDSLKIDKHFDSEFKL